MSNTLNVAAVKKFHKSPETRLAIAAVKTARAAHARVFAHVESYLIPAFAAFKPFTREISDRDLKSGERITEHKDLFMCDDSQDLQCAEWYAECDRLHAEHGYNVEPGVCPALLAEDDVRKAERALLTLFEKLIGREITLERLRKEALELCLNPPREK